MSSLFTESYESATVGAALSETNTSHAATSSFGGWTCQAATPSPASGLGAKYAEVSVAAGVARYLRNDFASAGQVFWRAYVYVPAGSGGNVDFASFRLAGGGRARIGTNGDGTKFIARNGATTVYNSTVGVPIGEWFRLEWRGDTAGSQELRIFTGANLHGTVPTETSGSVALATGNFDEVRTGPANNALTGAWVCDYDGVAADNATWVGPAVTNTPPTANAGADQTGKTAGSAVTLSGSDSDSDGTVVTRAWTQLSGTSVSLSGASTATATFTVPSVAADETLTFQYAVTDDDGATTTDTCTVGILAPGAAVSTLVDDFTSIDSGVWASFGTVANTGGRARATPIAAYSGYYTLAKYSLLASSIYVEVPTLPTADSGVESLFILSSDANNRVGFVLANNGLTFRRIVAGTMTDPTIAYSAVDHRWLRLRETGGTVYWDTSPDGTTWTNRYSWAHSIPLTNLTVDLDAGIWDGGSATGYAEFDNLNVPPVTGDDGGLRVYLVGDGGVAAECAMYLVGPTGSLVELADVAP